VIDERGLESYFTYRVGQGSIQVQLAADAIHELLDCRYALGLVVGDHDPEFLLDSVFRGA
jgi:hypothetical protein